MNTDLGTQAMVFLLLMTNRKAMGHTEDMSTQSITDPILLHNLCVQIFRHLWYFHPPFTRHSSLSGQMLLHFGWSLIDNFTNQQDTLPNLFLACKLVLNSLFDAIPNTTWAINMNVVNVTQTTISIKHPVTLLFMYFSTSFY